MGGDVVLILGVVQFIRQHLDLVGVVFEQVLHRFFTLFQLTTIFLLLLSPVLELSILLEFLNFLLQFHHLVLFD